MLELKT